MSLLERVEAFLPDDEELQRLTDEVKKGGAGE